VHIVVNFVLYTPNRTSVSFVTYMPWKLDDARIKEEGSQALHMGPRNIFHQIVVFIDEATVPARVRVRFIRPDWSTYSERF
jgi:hypothetical protein